jgi:hypothetical protein
LFLINYLLIVTRDFIPLVILIKFL